MNTTVNEPTYITHPRKPPSAAVRTLHGAITIAAWVVYAYLWLPVITVVAWYLGVRTSWVELGVKNYSFDQATFGILFTLAIVATVLLIGWAEYNRHKFGRHDRRTPILDVGVDDVAGSLNTDAEVSRTLAGSKSITLAMGDDARPVGIHRHTPLSGLL
ncbi:poly-beta-1,6-N-acetyl-D-glucosamine biosynthesis protein PgaD [Lysobacter humi (ex Lee et al. 2017)]